MSEAQAQAATAGHGPPASVPTRSMLAMGGLFVVSIVLAMVAAPLYLQEVGPIFTDPNDVGNSFQYLAIVIVFTAIILVIARYKMQRLIQLIILGAVLMSLVYLFGPLLSAVLRPRFGETGINAAWGAAIAVSVALTIALAKWPEWWVIDAVGVGVSAGAGAYFGISFGLVPSLALLVAFAAYDAIAVYRTKHMIALADSVMQLHLPIMLVVPKRRGYSFREDSAHLKEKLEKGEEREALFMGLGDVVIPCVLVVSALMFLDPAVRVAGVGGNLVVSVATLVGALCGYALLMVLVSKGKAHAGLPSLNGGAIALFLLTMLPIYGVAPLLHFGVGA